MPQHRGSLPGVLPQHHCLGINQPEGVDDNLAGHRLHRVHHDCHRSRIELFEGVLGGYIYSREPAPETWM
jgi:hypothetical protein